MNKLVPCRSCGKPIPYIGNSDFDTCDVCYHKHQSFWENKQKEADETAYTNLTKKEQAIDALICRYLNICGYAVNINFKSHRYQLIRFLSRKKL